MSGGAASKLTLKQEAFCLAYVETGNASEAYRRAGLAQIFRAPAYYTYFLIDPRDEAIFYVGKGIGRRLTQHVGAVKAGRVDNPAKCRRIADILAAGECVVETIFSTHEEAGAASHRAVSAIAHKYHQWSCIGKRACRRNGKACSGQDDPI